MLHEKLSASPSKTNKLVLYGAIVPIYFESKYETQKYTLGRSRELSLLKQVVHIITIVISIIEFYIITF
jgi:hypothetical protein